MFLFITQTRPVFDINFHKEGKKLDNASTHSAFTITRTNFPLINFV